MAKAEDKVLYAELTPQEFRERIAAVPIAYLPLGTLEWHGEHLPLGADGIQSQGFFEVLAREVGGIVLPMLFLGPDMMREEDGRELYGMDIWGSSEGRTVYESRQLAGSAYWVPDETSLVMALRPELVQMERLPRDRGEWPLAIGGKDPREFASPEFGRKAIALQTERMAKLLREALSRL